MSTDGLHCSVIKQRPDHFGGEPLNVCTLQIFSQGSLVSPEKNSSCEKDLTWLLVFWEPTKERRLKVFLSSALLTVQHLSPLLTGVQIWRFSASLYLQVLSFSRFLGFELFSGMSTSLTRRYLAFFDLQTPSLAFHLPGVLTSFVHCCLF